MPVDLHTSRFRLSPDGRLEVYDPKLATRINRQLKTYEGGAYSFQPGEEALFHLSQIEMTSILSRFLAPKSTRQSDPLPTLTPGLTGAK